METIENEWKIQSLWTRLNNYGRLVTLDTMENLWTICPRGKRWKMNGKFCHVDDRIIMESSSHWTRWKSNGKLVDVGHDRIDIESYFHLTQWKSYRKFDHVGNDGKCMENLVTFRHDRIVMESSSH